MRSKKDREAARVLAAQYEEMRARSPDNPIRKKYLTRKSRRFHQTARTHWPAAEVELDKAAGLLWEARAVVYDTWDVAQDEDDGKLLDEIDAFFAAYDGRRPSDD